MRKHQAQPGSRKARTVQLAATLICSLVAAAPSFAGSTMPVAGEITFSAASAAAIPTMGSIPLILLSCLLAVIAIKSYRRTGGVAPSIVGLLCVAALAGTGSSIHLVQQVNAIEASPVDVDQPGTKPLMEGLNNFQNTSDSALNVDDIQYESTCGASDNQAIEGSVCAPGIRVSRGDSCSLEVVCPLDDRT